MHSRALLTQGGCLLAVLIAFAAGPASAPAATQVRADASDARDGAFGKADLRSLTWDIGPAAASLTVSADASTFAAGRADIAIDVLLDTDADGIADRDIAATRNPDGLRIDVRLSVLGQTVSTADCQDLTGAATPAQATLNTTLGNGLETFTFSFDPLLVPGGLTAFRWAAFGQAPRDRAAGGPWDFMPDAANPTPSALNPGDRRCGAGLSGVNLRILNGVAFPDPVVSPAPLPAPPAEAPAPPSAPSPAAIVASFLTSSKNAQVSSTGVFTYSFVATPGSRGTISLKSTKRVRTAAKKRFVKLAATPFAPSSTGRVKVKLRLSKRDLRLLRRVKHLRFRVTVVLDGKTFTATLTLKAPPHT
jgi:hypothetical protein